MDISFLFYKNKNIQDFVALLATLFCLLEQSFIFGHKLIRAI